jgi:hypothetical protein
MPYMKINNFAGIPLGHKSPPLHLYRFGFFEIPLSLTSARKRESKHPRISQLLDPRFPVDDLFRAERLLRVFPQLFTRDVLI